MSVLLKSERMIGFFCWLFLIFSLTLERLANVKFSVFKSTHSLRIRSSDRTKWEVQQQQRRHTVSCVERKLIQRQTPPQGQGDGNIWPRTEMTRISVRGPGEAASG